MLVSYRTSAVSESRFCSRLAPPTVTWVPIRSTICRAGIWARYGSPASLTWQRLRKRIDNCLSEVENFELFEIARLADHRVVEGAGVNAGQLAGADEIDLFVQGRLHGLITDRVDRLSPMKHRSLRKVPGVGAEPAKSRQNTH